MKYIQLCRHRRIRMSSFIYHTQDFVYMSWIEDIIYLFLEIISGTIGNLGVHNTKKASWKQHRKCMIVKYFQDEWSHLIWPRNFIMYNDMTIQH
jgi:hypothetical protein